MLDQQFRVQGVGVIEIDLRPLCGWEVTQVFVIGVVRDINDMLSADSFQDPF
jgi:hypothetical protein